jgi:hypothetical protein
LGSWCPKLSGLQVLTKQVQAPSHTSVYTVASDERREPVPILLGDHSGKILFFEQEDRIRKGLTADICGTTRQANGKLRNHGRGGL